MGNDLIQNYLDEQGEEYKGLLEGATNTEDYGLEGKELSEVTMVKLTKQTKIKRLAGLLALKMAKANNDAMYVQYKNFRDKALIRKKKIFAKYGKKAIQMARKTIKK